MLYKKVHKVKTTFSTTSQKVDCVGIIEASHLHDHFNHDVCDIHNISVSAILIVSDSLKSVLKNYLGNHSFVETLSLEVQVNGETY